MVPSYRRRSHSTESASVHQLDYRRRGCGQAGSSSRCCLESPSRPRRRFSRRDYSPRRRSTDYDKPRRPHWRSRLRSQPGMDNPSQPQRAHYEQEARRRRDSNERKSRARPYAEESASHEMPRGARQPLSVRPPATSNDRYAGKDCQLDKPAKFEASCENGYSWKPGRYVADDCGSGIIQNACDTQQTRNLWCRTPLSVYQATICELGRKLLCGELRIPRHTTTAPPCNVCETILPPCRGYYRKYERMPSCEEKFVTYKHGKKQYRDKLKRHWEPCVKEEHRASDDITKFAGHNSYLAMKLSTKSDHDISRL